MRKIEEIIKNTKAEVPEDYNASNTILTKVTNIPLFLQPLTNAEIRSYNEKSINYIVHPPIQQNRFEKPKSKHLAWNVEVDIEADGNFEKDTFISKNEPNITHWMVCDDKDNITGPFTNNEMVLKMELNDLDTCMIKKVTGDEYVPFILIKNEYENPFEGDLVDLFAKKLLKLQIKESKILCDDHNKDQENSDSIQYNKNQFFDKSSRKPKKYGAPSSGKFSGKNENESNNEFINDQKYTRRAENSINSNDILENVIPNVVKTIEQESEKQKCKQEASENNIDLEATNKEKNEKSKSYKKNIKERFNKTNEQAKSPVKIHKENELIKIKNENVNEYKNQENAEEKTKKTNINGKVVDQSLVKDNKNKDIKNAENKKKEGHAYTPSEMSKIRNDCIRSQDFLKRNNVKNDLASLTLSIRGKTKQQAIETLSWKTGMKKMECDDFIELFVRESKIKICRDMDADGFISVKSFKNK